MGESSISTQPRNLRDSIEEEDGGLCVKTDHLNEKTNRQTGIDFVQKFI